MTYLNFSSSKTDKFNTGKIEFFDIYQPFKPVVVRFQKSTHLVVFSHSVNILLQK